MTQASPIHVGVRGLRMRKHLFLTIGILTSAALGGCGGPAADTAPINVNTVVERAAKTLVEFDAYLRRYDYKNVDQAMYQQFNTTVQHDLNKAPRFHPTRIVTQIRKDTSIMGYGDLNGNGKVDEKEPKLFKMEFDGDNSRIIVTSAAYSNAVGHSMRGPGFFTGVMIGSMLNRQTTAGIKPGHFNGRNVAGAPATTTKVASRAGKRGSATRSAARSGGIRGGK